MRQNWSNGQFKWHFCKNRLARFNHTKHTNASYGDGCAVFSVCNTCEVVAYLQINFDWNDGNFTVFHHLDVCVEKTSLSLVLIDISRAKWPVEVKLHNMVDYVEFSFG